MRLNSTLASESHSIKTVAYQIGQHHMVQESDDIVLLTLTTMSSVGATQGAGKISFSNVVSQLSNMDKQSRPQIANLPIWIFETPTNTSLSLFYTTYFTIQSFQQTW